MSNLKLLNVTKSFGQTQIIKGVDLSIQAGEFVVFVGPSGCGKSTLLRMICGLEEITSGELMIDHETVNNLSPKDRGIGMVFQSYALYPHMTVYENMAFGLQVQGNSKAEIKQKIEQTASSLKLSDYLERKPKELSGGQRQRVAIGRALVRNPRIFLFDEPLSNLDAALRVHMRMELAQLHQMNKATMIYVTHDQVEAMTLADKIVVLNDGEIEQVGTPLELYNQPKNIFVAGFIGSPKMNFIDLDTLDKKHVSKASMLIGRQAIDATYTIGIRPEHILIDSVRDCSRDKNGFTVSAIVRYQEQLGGETLIYSELTDSQQIITTKSEGQHQYKMDDIVNLTFPKEAIHLFDINESRIEINFQALDVA
ncbi:sn-glycerol-3-phosphate ABC transporter ATP-binding protein UgpC [Vibrio kyushuensis]|uniref:ABC transporter ATP-binding protein n=1 Tax=Vibrio kyushuensis TaxID=2910249 RepID=UPI003D13ADF2